jgi:hypothetical protein
VGVLMAMLMAMAMLMSMAMSLVHLISCDLHLTLCPASSRCTLSVFVALCTVYATRRIARFRSLHLGQPAPVRHWARASLPPSQRLALVANAVRAGQGCSNNLTGRTSLKLVCPETNHSSAYPCCCLLLLLGPTPLPT